MSHSSSVVRPSSPLTAALASLLVIGAVVGPLLFIGVAYRETTLGLYTLGGILALLLAGAIFVRPELGTYVLIVTVFTNISTALTNQGSPSINKPLVGLIFVSVLATRLWHRPGALRLKRLEWLMVAYLGVLLLSTFVAHERTTAAEQAVDFAKDFVILLCIVYSLDSERGWKRAVWLTIATAVFLSLLTIYQVVTGHYQQTFLGLATNSLEEVAAEVAQVRHSGPVGDPNFYAQILVAVIPLALYRAMDEKKLILRLVAAVSVIIILFAMMNTYSRGAFLALAGILALIAIERRIRVSHFLTLAGLGLVVLQLLPAGYTERLSSLVELSSEQQSFVYEEESFRGRLSEILSGLQMFATHPLLGVGVGNYEYNYQDYASRLGLEGRTTTRQAHSLYVETAAETGLFGLLALGGIFTAFFLGLRQAARPAAGASQATTPLPHDWRVWLISLQMSVLAYLMSSVFLHGDYIRYLWLLVALGASAVHLTERFWQRSVAQRARRWPW